MRIPSCALTCVLTKGFFEENMELIVLVWEVPVSNLQSITLLLNGVPGLEPEGSEDCKMPNPWVLGEGGKEM